MLGLPLMQSLLRDAKPAPRCRTAGELGALLLRMNLLRRMSPLKKGARARGPRDETSTKDEPAPSWRQG